MLPTFGAFRSKNIFAVIFALSFRTYLLFIVKSKIMDESTKRKISNKLKGRKKQARTKWLISQSMKGKQKTDKHRQAISEGMGRYWKTLHQDKSKVENP